MVEEFVVAAAEVIESGLTVGCKCESVFGAFTIADVREPAFDTLTWQCGPFGQAE